MPSNSAEYIHRFRHMGSNVRSMTGRTMERRMSALTGTLLFSLGPKGHGFPVFFLISRAFLVRSLANYVRHVKLIGGQLTNAG